eukprot:TRINITY_DN10312_c1_g1_i4.p1 TRINITY_DN10312_c1_g1~~TRINITY_DN10312_c1_g1_i4.p1  ORF type:complete len:213 (-),score=-21.11 TRINITY_DN10312_c1_g1_i4:1236-1874(-)
MIPKQSTSCFPSNTLIPYSYNIDPTYSNNSHQRQRKLTKKRKRHHRQQFKQEKHHIYPQVRKTFLNLQNHRKKIDQVPLRLHQKNTNIERIQSRQSRLTQTRKQMQHTAHLRFQIIVPLLFRLTQRFYIQCISRFYTTNTLMTLITTKIRPLHFRYSYVNITYAYVVGGQDIFGNRKPDWKKREMYYKKARQINQTIIIFQLIVYVIFLYYY